MNADEIIKTVREAAFYIFPEKESIVYVSLEKLRIEIDRLLSAEIECKYFELDQSTSSATICKHCSKEKFTHSL